MRLANLNKTYIIAEAGSNHDGKLSQAKKLIDIAADAGADAIKFQIFKAVDLYHPECGHIEFMNEKLDLFDFFKKMEFPVSWIPQLKQYADDRDIDFLFSVFSPESLDYITQFDINAIKIASPELNYLQLFEQSAKLNKPIFFSTGISTMSDISETVDILNKYHDNFAILHCITAYPAPLDQSNLNVLKTLSLAFDKPVGLSDHTMDFNTVSPLAVAMGAKIIEKHFTISRNLSGADHKFALEPHELTHMISEIRFIETLDRKEKIKYINNTPNKDIILGNSVKAITEDERLLYECDRRSLLTLKPIQKGDIISKENIGILRAERNITPGIEPKYLNTVLGKKATADIPGATGLLWEHLLTKI